MGFRQFAAEVRRRRIIRATLVYVLVAWVVVQVAETTFPSLNLPDWALTFVIAIVAICFPIALVLAWAYDLEPGGEKMIVRTPPAGEASAATSTTAPGYGAMLDSGPSAVAAAEAKSDADGIGTDGKIRSLSILPFVDLSPERDQEYFGDGIAEELLNTITGCCPGRIRVSARTSSFAFKGTTLDVREIGRRLNVDAVVEGSVRKAGDRLRINVQVIGVHDGFQIWSQRYDRKMDDLFAIQDEIAASVADALGLPAPAEPQATEMVPSDVRAYEFYLQGRHEFNKLTRRSLHSARGLFERAIEIDPEFGRAYAGLTNVYFFLHNYWEPNEENLRRAEEASLKALRCCPDMAEAHIARGQALSLIGSEKAKAEFQRAIELDPNHFDAYLLAARFHYAHGDTEEAVRLFRQAHEIRPEEYQALVLCADSLRALGRTEEAERTQFEALEAINCHLELYPDDARAYYMGAAIWRLKGEPDKADEWAERALALEPDDAGVHYNLACFYSRGGEMEKALAHLQRSVELGFAHRAWAENDADLRSLRDEPGFAAALDRMDSISRSPGSSTSALRSSTFSPDPNTPKAES